MGTERNNLTATFSVPDDAADDLVLFRPFHPPNACVNIVSIELNSSHDLVQNGALARL